MSQAEVNQLTEAVKEATINSEGAPIPTKNAGKKAGKAEKPAKQPPPPPPEDHAKDRYGKLEVNFSKINHSGTNIILYIDAYIIRIGLD